MILVSRGVDHPKCVRCKSSIFVPEYESQMVIKPFKSFDDVGLEYVLTYLDDPQSVFPSFAYNWMATSGIDEFLDKLHKAAQEIQEGQKSSNTPQQDVPANNAYKDYVIHRL